MRGVPRTAFAPSSCCVSGLKSGGSGHHCTCAAWLNSLLPLLSNRLARTRQPLRKWATTTTANTAGCFKQQLQAYSTARAWLRRAKPANKKLVEGSTKAKSGFSTALLAPNLRHSTILSNPLYLHTAPSGASALAYTKAHTSLSVAVAAVWKECKPKSFGSCVWQRQNSNPNLSPTSALVLLTD